MTHEATGVAIPLFSRIKILGDAMTESLREQRKLREQNERRADIVRAASLIIGEKGYEGAQIAEIASAAEVSLASVYGLFEGKEEIYQAVMVSAAESIREIVFQKVEPVDDPAERLLTLVDSLFDCFEQNRDLLRLYARSTGGLPWRLRQSMGDSSAAIFQRFTEWVVGLSSAAKSMGYLRDLDPEAFARTLIGAVTTTAAAAIETRPEKPLTDAAPEIRAICKRILGNSGGQESAS